MLLQLDGGIRDGAMEMQGRLGESEQKIRWTPRADGTVLQEWDQSGDGGASWTNLFGGLYSPDHDGGTG
jgi:hypothetical protein